MKNSKAIGITVIVLALMNVALLSFLWLGKRQDQRLNKGVGGLMVLSERLELTESQKERLESLRQEHFQRMEPLGRQSHQSRELLHSLWANGGTPKEVDSLSNRIGDLQAQIEKNTFQHFADIRALCTPKQKEIFDQIIKDVLKQGDRSQAPPGRGPDQRPPPRR